MSKDFVVKVFAPPSGGSPGSLGSDGTADVSTDPTVLTLWPNAAGSNGGWSVGAGSGTHYLNVNEAVADDFSTFNTTATPNAIDTYGLDDTLPSDAVVSQIEVFERAAGTTTDIIQIAIRSGGANYFSGNQALSDGAWTVPSNVWTTDPATGVAWTKAGIDALEAGAKYISGATASLTQLYVNVTYTEITSAGEASIADVEAVNPTAGAFIRAWPDVATLPAFRWAINSGPQALSLTLPRAWGAAGEVGESGSLSDLQMENQVDIYVVDEDTASAGRLLYRGFIEDYEVGMPATDGVPITLVPYTSLFQDTFIEGPLVFTAADPTDMLRTIVALYMPGIVWDSSNPLLGLTFNQTIENMKVSSAIEIIRRLAGSQWFYRLNPDNSITFSFWDLRRPGTHQLNANHYANVKFKRSRQDVKTRGFLFGQKEQRDNDGVLTQPRISVSVASSRYNPARPRDLFRTDTRITDNATALRILNAELEYYRPDSIEGTIEVIDGNYDAIRGYDIESLIPGDTVEFFHPDLTYDRPKYDRGYLYNSTAAYGGVYASLVRGPLVIDSVDYRGTSAVVHLTTRPAGVIEALVGVADKQLLADSA